MSQSFPGPGSSRAVFSTAANVIVTRDDGRVLLVHHAKSRVWVPPGGKAEWDESPWACAAREGAEELGVPVQVQRLLTTHWFTAKSGLWFGATQQPFAYPCLIFSFHATIAPDDMGRITAQESELLGYDWWDIDKACTPGLMEPSNASNLRAAMRILRAGDGHGYLEDGIDPAVAR